MGWLNKLFNLDSFKSVTDSEHSANNFGSMSTPTQKETASGSSASKRLKLVLMHDRTQLSPAMMEQMRDELVEVISRYVVIDKNALDINLESESNTIALVANIPVLRTRSGIDETLTQQQLQQPSDVLPNAVVTRQAAHVENQPKANASAPFSSLPSQQQQQPFAKPITPQNHEHPTF